MHVNFSILFTQGVFKRSELFHSTHFSLQFLETACEWLERIDVTLRNEVMYEPCELARIRPDVNNRVDIQIAEPPEPILGHALRFNSEGRKGSLDKSLHRASHPQREVRPTHPPTWLARLAEELFFSIIRFPKPTLRALVG
jgi:hypothetical protein